MSEPVRVAREGALGRITLSRPERLNALDRATIAAMTRALGDLAADPAVALVAVVGEGEAFCAGGDVREIHAHAADLDWVDGYYAEEYRLDRAVKRFPKPYVAIMDGVTMGGGAGVALHGAYRVATEATLFAMPEARIGHIPDVGASYALPRLPHRLGMRLALTGLRLGADDCVHGHVADYLTRRSRVAELLAALAAIDPSDDVDGQICEALAMRSVAPGPSGLAPARDELEAAYGEPTLDAVLARLDAGSDTARADAAMIRQGAPFALSLAFEMMRRAEAAMRSGSFEIEAALATEYRLTRASMRHGDFFEGVRAALIDRDGAPKFHPATLAEVDPSAVEAAFAPIGAAELTFPELPSR